VSRKRKKPRADEHHETRLESATQWVMIALLVFAPLAFGCVDPWSEEIALSLSAALAVLFCLQLLVLKRPALARPAFVWSRVYWPILLFLGLVLLQIAPLPDRVIQLLSPRTHQFLHPGVVVSAPARSTLSLYKYETLHSLRILLMVVTVFVVALNTLVRSSQMIRVLAAVAALGIAEALINLLQFAAGTHLVLGLVPMANPNSGTFAGHAHFGQLMNLCCGAILGLMAFSLSKIPRSKSSGAFNAPFSLFDRHYRPIVRGAVAVLVCFFSLCLSLTRSGMVAFMIAGLVVTLTAACVFARRRQFLFSSLAVGACVILFLVTGFESAYNSLATVEHFHDSLSVRPQIAHDLLAMFKAFPLFGTGLGTHATAYPAFQSVMTGATVYDADDEYLQLIEETGAIGAVIAIAFLVLLFHSIAKSIASCRRRPIRLVAFGLGFGLLAILIQSGTDFGQQLPSLACITAVFCAILFNLSQPTDPVLSQETPAKDSSAAKSVAPALKASWLGTRLIPAAMLAAVLLVSAVLLRQADHARRADAAWQTATIYDTAIRAADWQADNDAYGNLISSTAKAAQLEPQNARYAYWLCVYRWQALARKTTAAPDPAWLQYKHDMAARIVDDLLDIRATCPTYAPPYAAAAQIELKALNQPGPANQLMDVAHRLAPSDPSVLMADAELKTDLDQVTQACALLQTCVEADRSWTPRAVSMMLSQNRPDLAMQICGSNMYDLIDLLHRLPPAPQPQPVAPQLIIGSAKNEATKNEALKNEAVQQEPSPLEKIRAQLFAKINQLAARPDADQNALATFAQLCLDNGDAESAVLNYRRALEGDYSQIDWRLGLARALVTTGQTEAAISELRTCQRLAPERNDVRDYLETIITSPRRGKAANNTESTG
jgi:O-antigen ligase